MTVPLPELFKRVTLAPGGVRINTLIGGNEQGTPVLLLHGYPQTWYMWRKVMPALAGQYTCGHWVAEESPELLLKHLLPFLG